MAKVAVIAGWAIRLLGLALIVIGIVLWTGHGAGLRDLHITLGMLLVVALWLAAGAAARRSGASALVVVAILWGLLLPFVGIGQLYWLNGGWHWTVQVVHLLIGLAAMGMGERLVKRALAPAA